MVGVGWSITGKFLGRFLAVLGDVFAARILGPALFGLYSIGWTLLRMLSLVVHVGLPNGVQRFIPVYIHDDHNRLQEVVKLSIIISLFSGLVCGMLLYAFSPAIAQGIYHKPGLTIIFRLFAISLPFISLLSTVAAATRATKIMSYSVLIEDVGQPFFAILFLVIFYIAVGVDVNWVILSDLSSFLVTSMLAIWAVRRLFHGFWKIRIPSLSVARELLRFSVSTALAGTFAVFVFWVDRLMVGYFLSEVQNGLYQAASQISVIFVIVLSAFNSILAPMFAGFHASNDYQQLNNIFKVGTKWGLYLSLPVFLVFCFVPRELLSVIYGQAYSDAWPALVILSVGQIINVGTGSIGSLLSMTGHHRLWLALSIAGITMNICLCVLLIPRFGIVGAALGTAISLNLMYFAGLWWARRHLKIWPYDGRYIKGVVAFVGSILIFLGMVNVFPGSDFAILLLGLLISFVSFFGMLLWLGVDEEDRHLAELLIPKRIRNEANS